jgi:hypothetical protein
MNNNTIMNSSELELLPDFVEIHRGKFTGSGISKLVTPTFKIADNDTSRGYIFLKALEKQFGVVHDITATDLERGKEMEPLAFNKFNDLYGPKFITADPSPFIPIGEDAGATPDGIVSDGAILEIKSPTPVNFFKLVHSGEIKHEYACQLQMEMMAAQTDRAYFFNYCVINGIEYTHTIIVEEDPIIHGVILHAIERAVEKREEYISNIISKLNY